MIDITEDLRLYKELHKLYCEVQRRKMDAVLRILGELGDEEPSQPLVDADRLDHYYPLSLKLKKIALSHDAVSITDSTLYPAFNQIRIDAFDEEIDENGGIISDDYFYGLIEKHHPEQISRNLAATKPLVSMTHLVPPEVESLISETRTTYSLGLPTACISLCRSTVERAIVDIAIRCERNKDSKPIETMGMCDRVSLLIDRSASHSSPLRQKINKFNDATSSVIHSNTQADMASALELYHTAIELIQQLYNEYRTRIKK